MPESLEPFTRRQVLIDTSAWISYFRGRDHPASQRVAELIANDRAAMTGPVLCELLHGVRDGGEARRLNSLLEILPCHEVERADWVQAGDALRELRRNGITLPPTDALIATVARRRRLLVLTLDQHFRHLAVDLASI